MRKLLLALLVTVVATGCAWTQFGGSPGHTGFQVAETTIGPTTVSSLHEIWTANVGTTASSPIVADGTVYVGYGSAFGPGRGDLAAFDAAGQTHCSGTPKVCNALWVAATDVGVDQTPAYDNGRVYVVPGLGGVVALDAAGPDNCPGPTCTPQWSSDQGFDPVGSPTVGSGVVYVATVTNGVYAYDAAGPSSSCSTTNGITFCQPLWTAAPASPVATTVTVGAGHAFVVSADGTLSAYHAGGKTNCSGAPKVCTPLWTAPGAGSSNPSPPVVTGGTVYALDGTRTLRAFDAGGTTGCSGAPTTCAPLWTAAVPPSAGASTADVPAVANGRVYVGNAVFDATGTTNCTGTPKVCTPLWTTSGDGRSPIVANGLEFTGGQLLGDGTVQPLRAFDATGTTNCTGAPVVCTPLWSLTLDRPVASSPAIDDGVLYLTEQGGPRLALLHAYAPASP